MNIIPAVSRASRIRTEVVKGFLCGRSENFSGARTERWQFRIVWRIWACYPARNRALGKSDFLGSVPSRVTALYQRISRECILSGSDVNAAIYETWHLHSVLVHVCEHAGLFRCPAVDISGERRPPRVIFLFSLRGTNAISAFDIVAAVSHVRKTPRFAKCVALRTQLRFRRNTHGGLRWESSSLLSRARSIRGGNPVILVICVIIR